MMMGCIDAISTGAYDDVRKDKARYVILFLFSVRGEDKAPDGQNHPIFIGWCAVRCGRTVSFISQGEHRSSSEIIVRSMDM